MPIVPQRLKHDSRSPPSCCRSRSVNTRSHSNTAVCLHLWRRCRSCSVWRAFGFMFWKADAATPSFSCRVQPSLLASGMVPAMPCRTRSLVLRRFRLACWRLIAFRFRAALTLLAKPISSQQLPEQFDKPLALGMERFRRARGGILRSSRGGTGRFHSHGTSPFFVQSRMSEVFVISQILLATEVLLQGPAAASREMSLGLAGLRFRAGSRSPPDRHQHRHGHRAARAHCLAVIWRRHFTNNGPDSGPPRRLVETKRTAALAAKKTGRRPPPHRQMAIRCLFT